MPFRVRAGDPSLGAGVVEDPAGVVEHLTDGDAVADELGPGRLDIGDGQQVVGGAGRGGGDVRSEDDGAGRPGRRELHDPETVLADEVGVEAPPQRLVERLGPVDVGDGNHGHFQHHVYCEPPELSRTRRR